MKTHTTNLFIGIDVHKKQWHVSIFTSSMHHRTISQPPKPEALKIYMDNHFPDANITCAYEAGKFGYWIQRQLQSYGYECLVVNPADIPTSNKENTNKTDPIDSLKIAKNLRAGLLHSIHVPSADTEGDRHLFRYRKKIWADLVRVKNRIKDKLLSSGITIPEKYDNSYWSKGFLNWLKTVEFPSRSTRLTLDFLLEQYEMLYRHFLKVSIEVRKIQGKAQYKKLAKLLRGIPGIGPLTTVLILSEIEDISRFSSFKKLNAYVGFRPTTYSSGDKDWKGRMTYRRHNALRSALVESAWTAVQKDPALLLRYDQLIVRHSKKRAIVIIARKLLSRIYHVLKRQEPYVLGFNS